MASKKTIGQIAALLPEANAADLVGEVVDGRSGDINFPYGLFKPLLTVGEVDAASGVALTGYPDGLAAYLIDDDTIRVVYQSESYATMSNETYGQSMESGVKFTGSKVHAIDYDRAKFADFLNNGNAASEMVEGSGFLFNTIYNVFGEAVDGRNGNKADLSAKWGNQTKADGTLVEFTSDYQLKEADFFFQSFCGAWYEQANKFGAGIGFADDVYLTAEEWSIGKMFEGEADAANETMGLAAVVVDIASSTAYTAPALGQTGYEKTMAFNTGSADYVGLVLAGYNHGQEPAPNRIYIGVKDKLADGSEINYSTANARDAFLARNGLLYGKIYGLALDNNSFADLGISSVDPTAKMVDDYMKDAEAKSSFSGRFYSTSYQWDGFDSPEAVKDTEMLLWEKASEQPTGFTFFNGDTKTEHPAVDPDITKARYVQNMTDEGGILAFDLGSTAALGALLDGLNGALPEYLDVDVTRTVAAIDGALTLKTNGAGQAANGEDASKHIEAGVNKMVAPDGLYWVKTSDGDYLIVDEDSGNDYGERKYVLPLNASTLTLQEDATGYFLAQAGGSKNPRQLAAASALGGAHSQKTSSEFSGSWAVTPLLAQKGDGSFYSKAELTGTKLQELIEAAALKDQTFIGSLQHKSDSGGQVADEKADYGGQVLAFNVDLASTSASAARAFNNKPVSLELGGAEIVAWIPGAKVAAVCGGDNTVRFVKYDANFQNPEVVLEKEFDGDIQSVAAYGNHFAVAESPGKTEKGSVSVYSFNSSNNTLSRRFSTTVGYLPDSIAWSPDGKTIVVANEGEPNDYYGTSEEIDPVGSISIIRLGDDKMSLKETINLGFDGFTARQLKGSGVRLSGENADNPEKDIEPEFVKITSDSKRAVVTLQENNAMVVVNLQKATLETPTGLGAKDWTGLLVDTSDEDGGYLPGERDFKSLYMPDGMDVFSASNGTTYAVMANEGDGRVRPDDVNFEADADGTYTLHLTKFSDAVAAIEDPLTGRTVYVYRDMRGQSSTAFEAEVGDEFFITWKFGAVADDGFYSDEKRAGKLDDPLGNSIVSGDGEGRLKTVVDQNTADSITGFGGRSFTIRDLSGGIIWDSGDELDRIAAMYGVYNDGRSDDKGVEPEHVEIATLGDRSFAFISLERGTSTLIPVYEITNVDAPEHVYTFHAPNSVSPEATEFVKTSANGGTLLVSSEVSGTLDAFDFSTSLV